MASSLVQSMDRFGCPTGEAVPKGDIKIRLGFNSIALSDDWDRNTAKGPRETRFTATNPPATNHGKMVCGGGGMSKAEQFCW